MARTERILGDFGFLKVKAVVDPKNHCTGNGYQFAERKGVDSVAFICYDGSRLDDKFLINKEFTPPNGEFMYRAFGGSIDKNKTKEEIVKDEVLEEAGYDIDVAMITYYGMCFVSTQMNQNCYLYMVDVTGLKPVGRKPQNDIEAMAQPHWFNGADIYRMNDWKAAMILMRTCIACKY